MKETSGSRSLQINRSLLQADWGCILFWQPSAHSDIRKVFTGHLLLAQEDGLIDLGAQRVLELENVLKYFSGSQSKEPILPSGRKTHDSRLVC